MDELPILDTLQMYVIFGTRNFLVYALLEKKHKTFYTSYISYVLLVTKVTMFTFIFVNSNN